MTVRRFPILADVFERVSSTFVVTLLSILASDAFNWQTALQLDNWKAWGFAALTAALTTLKGFLAVKVGGPSASLAPSVRLQPVDSSADPR